ncbi:hypothetical protein Tco_0536324 [Tanacetum coccineum]
MLGDEVLVSALRDVWKGDDHGRSSKLARLRSGTKNTKNGRRKMHILNSGALSGSISYLVALRECATLGFRGKKIFKGYAL